MSQIWLIIENMAFYSYVFIVKFVLLCVYRKVEGPRAPRDERRRAQHNEGAWSLVSRSFQFERD